MPAHDQKPIYGDVIRVTHIYLGPAADRFISRQAENHLHKPAQELTREDLLSLMDWIRAIVGVISEDTDIIEEYINELGKIAKPIPPKRKK